MMIRRMFKPLPGGALFARLAKPRSEGMSTCLLQALLRSRRRGPVFDLIEHLHTKIVNWEKTRGAYGQPRVYLIRSDGLHARGGVR